MAEKNQYTHAKFIRPEEQIRIHRLNNGLYGSVSLHGHDFFELLYIRSGKAVHRLNDKSFRAGAGDVFVIQAGDTHAFEPITPHFEWIDCLIMPGFVDYDVSSLLSSRKYYASDGMEIEYLMQAMLREYEEKKPAYLIKLRGYLLALLAELGRQGEQEKERDYVSRKKTRLLQEAVEYVHLQYRDKIKLDDAAAKLGISRSSLSRLFREQLHDSFAGFVNAYRLERGSLLLRSGDAPIRDIALECGFADGKHFRTQFRRRFGMTPGEYRRAAPAGAAVLV
ncbi:AraC family transcriptional regulator [Paenibacillus sacheonensis]|uniref:Helix-turn-helix domain-containing protein n=1 Tax=Paenibacillus sacheonensis TaxID=742054 RepID=A0A7X4YUG3_9BACL|nr:AraC family transcriptional regulator [Paenibacillus sacheonensis]MBM7567287.1 AraC-like DNA-binding protein [Paenibacillus sacheonensis]NBC72821.1 helix-turn-helix domain-containing protein [Paenibacillus sacheonensis]